MGKVSFIHVSDIHFGQEKGGNVYINEDAKKQLILDVRECIKELPSRKAAGVLVTGDVAFSGKENQYRDAARWLDELTAAAGCETAAVMVVPGNHDVDRSVVSEAGKYVLREILDKGQERLDEFLKAEPDRDLLYARFQAYQPFAEGYGCSLDSCGGRPAAKQPWELVPGKKLRFVGLNSALVCSDNDQKGSLLLGKSQWPIDQAADEEVVVLIHHPLDWLRDGDNSRTYIENRARVLISGHEHQPGINLLELGHGGQLLCLAAGATAPQPDAEDETYTYNILEFGWDSASDALTVSVHMRRWNKSRVAFEPDPSRACMAGQTFTLRRPTRSTLTAPGGASAVNAPVNVAQSTPVKLEVVLHPGDEMNSAPDDFPRLKLLFFRDLKALQRLRVLVSLKALHEDAKAPASHAAERRALEALHNEGRLVELADAIEAELRSSPQDEL